MLTPPQHVPDRADTFIGLLACHPLRTAEE